MKDTDLFEHASIQELKNGYIEDDYCYTCLLCNEKIEKGIIYPHNDQLFEAKKMMQAHIKEKHESVFNYLIRLNKKMTGLTEHQSNLLHLFYIGKSDSEIQKELEIGSTSTIRQHRFALKEKERQAKTFLALMELLKEKDTETPDFVPIHSTATMIDDRYNITNDEQQELIAKYFPNGTHAKIVRFPKKEKHKIVILREIAQHFSEDKIYTEQELNTVLKTYHEDYVLIRRYLIEYGFMDRKEDGSAYWIKK
ncbi:DUF2087 domain-containing protein [Rummeliibacillus pycnus]|uniref:DUF2087 domain-containing protein n=1 Tax=Rummeliibacillus pycnus TaxID=101070 RepID=UPI000C9CD032|nr:DUF2087 domain-containing protein [Rummeliibacillus pycnus]